MTRIILLLGLHLLTGVFWAGSTFALAFTDPSTAARLFRLQMAAATLSMLAGAGLWMIQHQGPPGGMERALGLGIVCAIAAAGVQGALNRRKPLLGQQIAAILLVVTVLSMTLARYVP